MVNIMMEFLIGKFSLAGLADMIPEGNEQAAITRMEIISMCKSVINERKLSIFDKRQLYQQGNYLCPKQLRLSDNSVRFPAQAPAAHRK